MRKQDRKRKRLKERLRKARRARERCRQEVPTGERSFSDFIRGLFGWPK